jgi:hypothetical protein
MEGMTMTQADRNNTANNRIQAICSGLSDLEEPLIEVKNLAYAARMLASSDEMRGPSGNALDTLASGLLDKIAELADERSRLYHLAYDQRRELAEAAHG